MTFKRLVCLVFGHIGYRGKEGFCRCSRCGDWFDDSRGIDRIVRRRW